MDHAAAQPVWVSWLPFAIFGLVMLLRMRSMRKARPLRLPMLWILPVLAVALVGLALFAMPLTALGWAAFVPGIIIGGAAGRWRAGMMHLHIEGEDAAARVMMRQSPAALLFIVAIFMARRLLPHYDGGDLSEAPRMVMLVTDFGLGFVPGLICGQRITLWLRARQMIAQHLHDS